MPFLRFGALWRVAVVGLAAGIATVAIIGIPTDVIPNPVFTRMTPVRTLDYVFLGLTAALAAALGGAYAIPARCRTQRVKFTIGGLLSVLAIGCPVCNKLVVLLLGVSGALTYFAPLQPALGLASIALLGIALLLRLRSILPGNERLEAARIL